MIQDGEYSATVMHAKRIGKRTVELCWRIDDQDLIEPARDLDMRDHMRKAWLPTSTWIGEPDEADYVGLVAQLLIKESRVINIKVVSKQPFIIAV